jgi:serine/threonine protein kinase/tetratricopeptide (TPR) repeat protein
VPQIALPAGGADLNALVERLTVEMAQRWQSGERPRAEAFLDRHPDLWHEPEAALELLYEELSLRQDHGLEVAAEELFGRFPQWRRQIQALLACHQLLVPQLGPPRFPALGELLGEFRLLAELGRGSQGRVYLAEQAALAGRTVVLKCGPLLGHEHLSLARLQHTHIVPLHSVHDFPDRRIRALCLPFFGGATLDRLLAMLQPRAPRGRTGHDLLEALRQASVAGPARLPVAGPICQFLERASYVQAVCWIGAALANALHYAHERGLLHLDVKASNVLLAADAQPMLLDFHLAHPPLAAGSPAPPWLGGTQGCMAPEQQQALEAVLRRKAVPAELDGRADIYALGRLLYELLGGEPPITTPSPGRALRRRNPSVSVGLADIIERCLSPLTNQRYPSAAVLAADLRRHLADLPLRGVVNRNVPERFGKWRRRHPMAGPVLGLLLLVLAAAGIALDHMARQTDKARAAFHEGQRYLDQERYTEARDTLAHGLALIDGSPFGGGVQHQLGEAILRAEQGRAIEELHLYAERVRPLYSAAILPRRQAQEVLGHCRTFWSQQALIHQSLGLHPADGRGQQVSRDLLDLAILMVHLRLRLASPGEIPARRREALLILDEAEAEFGPSCGLCRERQAHAESLGLLDVAEAAARQAERLPPQSAWEHLALGQVHFRAGEYQRAAREMAKAVELDPGGLWPNFYRGSCAYQLQQHEDAATAFAVCVALAPRCAWCYLNRGLAHAALDRLDLARHDYDHALGLDPTLAAAAFARSVVWYRQDRHREALDDLSQALDLGMNPAQVGYQRALVHLARQASADALESLRSALRHDPHHEQAKALLDQLQQRRER